MERRIDRVDREFAFADIVDADQSGQHGDEIGAGDEVEGRHHRIHLDHAIDRDIVALEIDFEIAPPDIVRPRRHDLQRRAVRQPHRRERLEPASASGDQHFAVAQDQPRFQAGPAFERRHDREVELVAQHLFGQDAAIGLDDMQPHVRMRPHDMLQRGCERGAGEGRHQPDPQRSAHDVRATARVLFRLRQQSDRIDAAAVIAQPGGRRRDAGRAAIEQPHAQRLLDRRHMLGDAGLGGMLPLGGTGEGAFLAHGDDGLDLAEAGMVWHQEI